MLPALAQAKSKAKQAACFNNLRQISIASTMYVMEFRCFPGTLSVNHGYCYVWATRLLSQMGTNRGVFYCPAAVLDSAWDTNVNKTLGATTPEGRFDPFGMSDKTRFSYGYNDWGVNLDHEPQLGLGGDINGRSFKGVVTESMIISPSQMIAYGDVRTATRGSKVHFNANLDPVDRASTHSQWPSNRHNYRTDIACVDGHVEAARRHDLIDPANQIWRRRWNNDNQPHPEYTWMPDWKAEAIRE